MEPQIYAELQDKEFNNRKYGTVVYFINKRKWYEIPLVESEVEKINEERTAIGLGTIEEYKRKVKYRKEDKYFSFKTFEGAVFVPKVMIQNIQAK
jgi:hypothetical protein